MNDLGMTVLRSAVQVTLVALPASALVLWAARRGAASAVTVATTALAILALTTAAAFCPLPAWWSWQPATAAATTDVTTEPHPEAVAPTPPGIAVGLDWLSHLRRLPTLMPGTVPTTESRPEHSGWSALAVTFLIGVSAGFGRLLLGLWAVSRCRRRSLPIADASLLALADELRVALGGRRPVELRESDEVGTAATVGWRCPAVLLAPDWPTWTDAERRGVLAHELSHACRHDYLTGLFARGCVALHFYHPLVRWLAGRLRLHQELAADAAAARCAGGHGPYLTALARMALRQDTEVRIGPALPFLSGRGTLLRRIATLRVKDDVRRPLSGAGRWAMVALLIGIGVMATALRGPAQPPAPPADDLPPFDLSYVPPGTDGIVCVRPSALFGQPGMKSVADQWGKQIAQAFVTLGLPQDIEIPLDAIEQVVGPVSLYKYGKPLPGGQTHGLAMGLSMIRMNRDYDWPALIRTLGQRFPIQDLGDGVYKTRWAGFSADQAIKVIDRRTLVFTWDEKKKSPAAAEPTAVQWGPAWKNTERASVAVALDNRKGRWTKSLEGKPEFAIMLVALGHPAHVVVAGPAGPTVGVNVSLTQPDEAAAVKTVNDVETLVKLGHTALAAVKPEEDDTKFPLRLAGELLAGRTVRRNGNTVTAEFRSSTQLAELLKVLGDHAALELKAQGIEPKEPPKK
jgi:hypothetical protein